MPVSPRPAMFGQAACQTLTANYLVHKTHLKPTRPLYIFIYDFWMWLYKWLKCDIWTLISLDQKTTDQQNSQAYASRQQSRSTKFQISVIML